MGYAATNVIPNIPTIFAPATAGFMVQTYGLVPGMRIVYTVVFFCLMAAAVIRLLFLRETLDTPQKIKLGEMKAAFKNSLGAIAEAWGEMPRTLRFLTIAFLVSAFEEPMFRMFTSLYVFDMVGVSEIEWGLVNTASVAITLVFGFPLGKVVDKIGRKRSIILANLLFIPASVFFLFSRSFVQLLVVFMVFGFGGCLIMPAYNALLADLIPREKRGRILGASALGGFLYGVDPAHPFVFAIVLGITVSLIILFMVKEPKTRER
jgi:MFS family permease